MLTGLRAPAGDTQKTSSWLGNSVRPWVSLAYRGRQIGRRRCRDPKMRLGRPRFHMICLASSLLAPVVVFMVGAATPSEADGILV